jgi:hypothetical protein
LVCRREVPIGKPGFVAILKIESRIVIRTCCSLASARSRYYYNTALTGESFHTERVQPIYFLSSAGKKISERCRSSSLDEEKTPKIETINRLHNETFYNFVSIKSFKTDDRLTEVLVGSNIRSRTVSGGKKYSFRSRR